MLPYFLFIRKLRIFLGFSLTFYDFCGKVIGNMCRRRMCVSSVLTKLRKRDAVMGWKQYRRCKARISAQESFAKVCFDGYKQGVVCSRQNTKKRKAIYVLNLGGTAGYMLVPVLGTGFFVLKLSFGTPFKNVYYIRKDSII